MSLQEFFLKKILINMPNSSLFSRIIFLSFHFFMAAFSSLGDVFGFLGERRNIAFVSHLIPYIYPSYAYP